MEAPSSGLARLPIPRAFAVRMGPPPISRHASAIEDSCHAVVPAINPPVRSRSSASASGRAPSARWRRSPWPWCSSGKASRVNAKELQTDVGMPARPKRTNDRSGDVPPLETGGEQPPDDQAPADDGEDGYEATIHRRESTCSLWTERSWRSLLRLGKGFHLSVSWIRIDGDELDSQFLDPLDEPDKLCLVCHRAGQTPSCPPGALAACRKTAL